MSLLGGLPEPEHGLVMVLLHPLTVIIHDSVVPLTAGISLLGVAAAANSGLGLLVPFFIAASSFSV